MSKAQSKVFIGSETFAVTESPTEVAKALKDAQSPGDVLVLHNRADQVVTVTAASVDGVTPMPGTFNSMLTPARVRLLSPAILQ
jgi:hypothetical protein